MKQLQLITISEEQTASLGRDIAMAILAGSGKGDLLLLSGDLGTGKTSLARALIRQIAKDDLFEVPSPTYTICHEYKLEYNIAHYDLYRLSSIEELDELGWQEQVETGSVIMEWPEYCFENTPLGAVLVSITENTSDSRQITLEGEGSFIDRIERSLEISEFLSNTHLSTPKREHLSADASARSYEIITEGNTQFFLMNSPAVEDGPIIRDGKPYSKIAHLAETVKPFVGIAKILRDAGVHAPEIPYFDLDDGILLIEHLGNEMIIDQDRSPIPDRYMMSVELLAELHLKGVQKDTEISKDVKYTIPNYDEAAVLIEAELLLDWYAPAHSAKPISEQDGAEFKTIWQKLFKKLANFEHSIVLRDYHSPNIIWMNNEIGINKIGVIDFQDAVIGPTSYDVASIAQDARVDISTDLEEQLVDHYIEVRSRNNPNFDNAAFIESYAIMAAQRATKILGIFIRLDQRDGKPEYLKHLPRIREYLQRTLQHEVLAEYKQWLERVIKL